MAEIMLSVDVIAAVLLFLLYQYWFSSKEVNHSNFSWQKANLEFSAWFTSTIILAIYFGVKVLALVSYWR
jgi:hypothetical protein